MRFTLCCNDTVCPGECEMKTRRILETSSVVTEAAFLEGLEEGWRPRKIRGLYSLQ